MVKNTKIMDNVAPEAGGVYIRYGKLQGCYISGNSYGGVWNTPPGIFLEDAKENLTGCTITNNRGYNIKLGGNIIE